MVTRLCIDQLRSAQVRRESYVGEWLPEPLVDDGRSDPADHADPATAVRVARHAEAAEFESIWTGEHLVLPDHAL